MTGGLNTTPRTWIPGETPTATNFNTEVRDPLTALQEAWTVYTPTVTGGPVSSISGRYMRIGKTIFCMGMATWSGAVTTSIFFGLPVTSQTSQTIQAIGTWAALDVGTSRYTGVCMFRDANNFYPWPTSGPSALGPTSPFTWVSGDSITWNITYEGA